jgi:regulator of nonsense transcripts 2
MKKNTAFMKRARTAITGPNTQVFLQEVSSLSLHRYISEIITACYEGLCKAKTPADIACGVELLSALHQRFGPQEFTGYMGWYIGRGLATPDKSQLKGLAQDVREREERERLARQRILLKIATELWLAGLLRSLEDVISPESEAKGKSSVTGKSSDSGKGKGAREKATSSANAEDEPFPLEVLKDLLGHDREHANLPLVVMFLKSFSWDVLGVSQRSSDRKQDLEEAAETQEHDGPPITSPGLQQRFKNIMGRYFEDVKQHVVRDQKSLSAQAKRNAEAYVRSGEVFEDRQANFEKQSKQYERLVSNAQAVADILDLEMPELKDKDESNFTGDGTIALVKAGEFLGQADGAGIWEDEDERRFYENLMDLKDRVPQILLADQKKKKGEEEPAAKEIKALEPEEQATSFTNKSVGAQVDGLLAKLPDLHTKDMADQFALDFCFLNSKASRNRLIKALCDVPKGRSDLLPLYSRIVATLSRYMPDVVQLVISHLDEEFRSLQRRKTKEFLGSVRLQNIRYFAELTKFGIVPEHVIFHCLKVCLEDLSRTNIEIMGNLMENCGRYLLRNSETAPRMASFLETLQRKKSAQHLEQRERLILENAMYFVNPPDRPAIIQKERSPTELYIQRLFYEVMNKRNVDKMTKLVRKLHWGDPEVVVYLSKVFTKPWRIRYNNIHLLAVVLGNLYRYRAMFANGVVDKLQESITQGLEVNDVKFNQRRIAQVKYLGELYAYRMVDSTVIFDTMYQILTFGHEGGTPRLNSENPLDAAHDFFRIRLVCTLLELCGSYFTKGPVRKKLDFFIKFFQVRLLTFKILTDFEQYYINTKDPRSADIEFAIQDAFAVVDPELTLINGYEDAAKDFAEAVKQNYNASEADKAVMEEEVEEEMHSDEDGVEEDDADDDVAKSDDESEEACVHSLQIWCSDTNRVNRRLRIPTVIQTPAMTLMRKMKRPSSSHDKSQPKSTRKQMLTLTVSWLS